MADLLSKAKISVIPKLVTKTSPEVIALIGEVAPYVKPKPVAKPTQGGGKSTGANAQRKRALREAKAANQGSSGSATSQQSAKKPKTAQNSRGQNFGPSASKNGNKSRKQGYGSR